MSASATQGGHKNCVGVFYNSHVDIINSDVEMSCRSISFDIGCVTVLPVLLHIWLVSDLHFRFSRFPA